MMVYFDPAQYKLVIRQNGLPVEDLGFLLSQTSHSAKQWIMGFVSDERIVKKINRQRARCCTSNVLPATKK